MNALTSSAFIDDLPAMVAILGRDGDVLHVNREMRDGLGETPEKLTNWGTSRTIHPEDAVRVADMFEQSIVRGEPYDLEQRMRGPDGAYRWYCNRGHPVLDETGAVFAWHVILTDIDERKRAVAALATSERESQLTIDSVPAMAWSARADGTGDFFNQQYLDYAGRNLDQMRDWQWTSLIHPEDMDVIESAWKEFHAAGTGGDVEARIRRHDGVYRWFLFRSNLLRDENGTAIKWFGINTDIDASKRSSLMLAGEKHLFELIASGQPLREFLGTLCTVIESALPGSLCEARLLDGGGSVFDVCVSPSLPATLGDIVTGTLVDEDLAPCGAAATHKVQIIARDIRSDRRWRGSPARKRLLAHGLRSVWSTPICSTQGAVIGTLCIFHRDPTSPEAGDQNIIGRAAHIASIATERFKAQEELLRRQYLLSTAERISETGSFSWDMQTNKLVWSGQMYRLFELEVGTDPTQVDLQALYHPEDLAKLHEKLGGLARGEGSADDIDRLIMPDGRIKYLSNSIQMFHHEDGRQECVGVSQDITRRHTSEGALDKLRSELAHVARVSSLGELTASITHEVNQPLSGIITNASAGLRMLAADPPDIEGAMKTAQRTLRDGNRASAVIQRLRGLFRKQDFVLEPLDLNDAATEVIAICAHDLQRRRISLSVRLDLSVPRVVGDRTQLQQVILNLVLNAADALGDIDGRPRQIIVETQALATGAVKLTVQDTGIGIAEEDVDKVFEAFFTTKPDGMGIGLSVSRSIIDRHGGKIWASSTEGSGTTFALSIPVADDWATGASASPLGTGLDKNR